MAKMPQKSPSLLELSKKRNEYIAQALFGVNLERPKILKKNKLIESESITSLRSKADNTSFLPPINPLSTKSRFTTPRSQIVHKAASNSLVITPNGRALLKSQGSIDQPDSLDNIVSPKMNRNHSVQELSQADSFQNSLRNKRPQPIRESHKELLKTRSNSQISLGRVDNLIIASQTSIADGENKPNAITDSLTESIDLKKFFNSYKPLDPNLYEVLKSLPNAVMFRIKNGQYYGETRSSSVRHGKGVMFYDNGRIYEGEWRDDQKKGKGIEKFPIGHVYEGEFLNGRPHGRGAFRWIDGDFYEGEFFEGMKHGKGSWRNAAGSSYTGDWVRGTADGIGTYRWPNGDCYEGQYKNSQKHGKGVENFINGDTYDGDYNEGVFSGFGVYYWSNGSVYKGEFKNGLREGKGVYESERGEMYQGSYLEGKKHGNGVFTWPSGNVYKGNFINDLRDGYGEMSWKDGSCYKGEWTRGIQNGKGELSVPKEYHFRGVLNKNVFGEKPTTRETKHINRSKLNSLKLTRGNFKDS